LENFYQLLELFMREYYGGRRFSIEEIRSEWQSPNFAVEKNTCSVFTPDNQLVGYAELWDTHATPVRPWLWSYVHPNYRGRGIGATLIQWGEARARQVFDRVPPEARVVVMTNCYSTNAAGKQLLEDNGFATERRSWNMLIEMDAAPQSPVWPAGITVSTLAERPDLAAVYRAFDEAFSDHRGYVAQPFEVGLEQFRHRVESNPDHDATLWFLALDGDQIAGVSFCSQIQGTDPRGTVETLGVRRAYRRRGVGMALLQHSFAELWQRGQRKVGLGVDATSLTGATRLYERAGMRVEHAWDLYEKELRPGVELSNQG